MEFRDYIEEGIAKCGTATALAKELGQDATVVRNAKAHRRGLPLAACYKLADLIGAPRDAVAAASALVTEKDEGIRAYLRPFVQTAVHVQHLSIAAIAGTIALTLALENSSLIVRGFLL